MNKLSYKKHLGAIIPMILAAMFVIGCVATIGTTVYSGIAGGMQKTSVNIKILQNLNQSSEVLMTESTRNSLGLPVVPQYVTGATNPVGGGVIPSNSNAPKTDYLGTIIGYCTNSATNQNTDVFVLISAGTNKIFDTTCSQAFSGLIINDDKVIIKTASSILQAISGVGNYAEPVNIENDLGNFTNVKRGEIRLVLSSKTIWTNITGTPGFSNWSKALLYIPSTLAPIPVIIKDPLTPCTASNDTSTNSAKEGFAISIDRQFIYLCSGGSWKNGVDYNTGDSTI